MQILSGNRFRLGLGAGENLNEHVVGKRWPAVGLRHEMLSEAVDIIAALFDSDEQRSTTAAATSTSSRPSCGTCPTQRVPIGVAVSGPRLVSAGRRQGRPDDRASSPSPSWGRCSTPPAARASRGWARSRSPTTPTATPRCARAHEQFRWFGLGWKVNADLPNPESFDAATAVRDPRPGRRAARLRARRRGARGEDQAVHRGRASTRWRSSRSAPTSRSSSSAGPSASCCRRCARCNAPARARAATSSATASAPCRPSTIV